MDKKLIRVGNSYALVIERMWLRRLMIGPRTRLRIALDHGDLIVHPVYPDPPMGVPIALGGEEQLENAGFMPVMQELVHVYQIMQHNFEVLTDLTISPCLYLASLAQPAPVTEEERAGRRRLRGALVGLRAGMDWPEAIEPILAEM